MYGYERLSYMFKRLHDEHPYDTEYMGYAYYDITHDITLSCEYNNLVCSVNGKHQLSINHELIKSIIYIDINSIGKHQLESYLCDSETIYQPICDLSSTILIVILISDSYIIINDMN